MSFKKFSKSCATIFISFFFTSFSYATIYYVSETGSDSNNGTSTSTPWKTITKVNSMMPSINAGDQILFNRGDSFYGSLSVNRSGSAGSEIVFGSYGSGNLPVITGKKLITGWSLYTGNIYRAPISDTIHHIYINGKIMTIARYPNSGFLKIDNNIGNTGFHDGDLFHSAGYWNGANCRIRSANWSYETKTVSNFSGGNITFSSATLYTTPANYGYYLDNKLSILDVQNEWFYDKAAGFVYLYAPGGVNPASIEVEGVVQKKGFDIIAGKNYIKIQNLNITGYSNAGVSSSSSTNISVLGCTITQTTVNAVVMNGTNGIINNNYFEDNLNMVFSGAIIVGEIKNNFINRTGLIPGYGSNARGYLALEAIYSKRLVIENNIIDSTGYSAMSMGNNNIAKNNYIDYSLLRLNDGAGIDIGDSDTLQILDNVILHTMGSTESSANPDKYGTAIYINAGELKNSTIKGNTCAYNTYAGIYFDHKGNPVNNKIIGNTLFNNMAMQILFADISAVVNTPVYNTIIKNNIFYSLQASQNCMILRTYTGASQNDYGNFDSNYYCNPYSDYTIRRTKFTAPYSDLVHSLDTWQPINGEDPHSHASQFEFSQYAITDTLSANLINNSQFNTNISQWASWPVGVTIGWESNPLLNGGALRMRWNGTGNPLGLSLSNRFSITSGYDYLISISSAGNHSGTFNMWGLSSLSGSTFLFPTKYFSYENYRKDYSFTFKADVNDPQAYLGLGLILPDSLTYFDNVSLYRVSVDKIDSSELSKLFVNSTGSPMTIPLNGIPYKDIDGNLVGASINLPAFSSKILINEGFIPSRKLQLKALFEGLYDPVPNTMVSDSATVYIRGGSAPYTIVDSIKSVLDANGNGTFNSFNAYNSTSYYIVVKHRNSLETWSGTTVSFSGDNLSYDFTTASNKAYGNNLKLLGSKYCIYSGDVFKDGQIELSDILQISNSANNFETGYRVEDLSGDGTVDLSDINLAFNNTTVFASIKRP